MTEYCPLGRHGRGRDLGIDSALLVARVIHFDLVFAEASSWQWWLAVSPYDYKDGLIYVDRETDDGEYRESKLLWALGNYSRFVRPGMVRVVVDRSDAAAHSDTVEELMVSSFFDQDRGILAAVVVNWATTSVPLQLNVRGLRVGAWVPYVTSVESDLDAHAPVPADFVIDIPARSIVTLVGGDSTWKG